ncbi:MAG: TIGR02450 family Trp-rich protein, partial [Gammaproteobacteria bacterium]|nr:TIGR02450 family Trp-rich protein [Gammaproteobacteria bacterium]
SKWTATVVQNKQKHFLVTRLIRDDQDNIVACEIEAVINRKSRQIDWRELCDPTCWEQGWQ